MLLNVFFVIVIAILGIVLYKMLGNSEKTYAYARTMIIRYRPDGTEQIESFEESGIVFIGKNTVTIDGQPFVYKSSDRKKIQARLRYEGGVLKSIHIKQPNGGEKLYYVDKITDLKSLPRR